MTADTLARWHAIVEARDLSALDALLAEDVVFQSPVVHTPQAGRAVTRAYLGAALTVLNNDTFRYVGTWHAEGSAVLEFTATVDGVEINGVDIIHWDQSGRITRFKVMVRPLKAIDLLRERMAAALARKATAA